MCDVFFSSNPAGTRPPNGVSKTFSTRFVSSSSSCYRRGRVRFSRLCVCTGPRNGERVNTRQKSCARYEKERSSRRNETDSSPVAGCCYCRRRNRRRRRRRRSVVRGCCLCRDRVRMYVHRPLPVASCASSPPPPHSVTAQPSGRTSAAVFCRTVNNVYNCTPPLTPTTGRLARACMRVCVPRSR